MIAYFGAGCENTGNARTRRAGDGARHPRGLEGLKEIRILGQRSFHQMLHGAVQESSFSERRYQLIQQAPRYLLEAVLVLFVVLLVLLTLRSEAAVDKLLGPSACLASPQSA